MFYGVDVWIVKQPLQPQAFQAGSIVTTFHVKLNVKLDNCHAGGLLNMCTISFNIVFHFIVFILLCFIATSFMMRTGCHG